jgi:hypothetical protein
MHDPFYFKFKLEPARFFTDYIRNDSIFCCMVKLKFVTSWQPLKVPAARLSLSGLAASLALAASLPGQEVNTSRTTLQRALNFCTFPKAAAG